MKRKIILLLMVFVLAISASASAKPKDRDWDRQDNHSKWKHSSYTSEKWHSIRHDRLPFTWHERRDYLIHRPGYKLDRVYDWEWNHRFPGLHAYRWHDTRGEGFWYQGRRVSDAVMFYDESDELVSIGFMHNGVFLFIRDDDNGFENRDSFFLSWWR